MRVLVLDASIAVRVRVVARLREAGLEVVGEAATAAAALALAAALAPEAVVMDLLLPDRRGLDAVAALRAGAPAAVVVVLTNATHYRDRCLAGGADHFLDKSTEFDAVAAALRGRLA